MFVSLSQMQIIILRLYAMLLYEEFPQPIIHDLSSPSVDWGKLSNIRGALHATAVFRLLGMSSPRRVTEVYAPPDTQEAAPA